MDHNRMQSEHLGRTNGRGVEEVTESDSSAPRGRIPRACVPTCGAAPSSSAGSGTTTTRYVLVTAARNEGKHLDRLIQSVAAQTVQPVLWVIVSDASTDGTDEIVTKYAPRFSWIKLLRMTEDGKRHYGRKALCFNAGWRHVRDLEFDVIANVDADVSFDPDYIAFLLSKFDADPRLGVAGTRYREGSYVAFSHRWADLDDVSGQFQMFRRTCLEDIGGYLPVREGGIDTIAVTMAKAEGWKARTFVEKTLYHHRIRGAWIGGSRAMAFRWGYRDYLLGNHPLWQFARSLFLMSRSPIVLGGLLYSSGYLLALVSLRKKNMPRNCVQLRRREQMQRLAAIGKRLVK